MGLVGGWVGWLGVLFSYSGSHLRYAVVLCGQQLVWGRGGKGGSRRGVVCVLLMSTCCCTHTHIESERAGDTERWTET